MSRTKLQQIVTNCYRTAVPERHKKNRPDGLFFRPRRQEMQMRIIRIAAGRSAQCVILKPFIYHPKRRNFKTVYLPHPLRR